MDNNRNLFITIILSVVILAAWQYFYIEPKIQAEREAQQQTQVQNDAASATDTTSQDSGSPTSQNTAADNGAPTPSATGDAANKAPASAAASEANVPDAGRVKIDTPTLAGSINLRGARFDDLELKEYHVTVDPKSDIVQLLAPASDKKGYFGEFGYVGVDGAPGSDAVWKAPADAVLTPSSPVELTYEAPNGLVFKRKISIDNEYMFDIDDTVTNGSGESVDLQGYGRVTRYYKPDTNPIYILHEGLVGVTGDEGLTETSWKSIEKDNEVVPGKSSDGWLGMTDKYWGTAMIPAQGETFQPRYSYFDKGRPRYQADFITDSVSLKTGGSAEFHNSFFAGAKKTRVIDHYDESRGIRQFDLMIDWGWFHFITKPMFYLLDFLYNLFGNFGLAIICTTLIVKAIFFPLANMSYRSMARMKLVQPKMQELKEKYGDDREQMQKAMMDLYRTEKINPVAGCWPMLIQIPIFFSLYKVIYITIEMRHAPFFGWIHDLSAPDPTSVFNLFGLLPFDPTTVPMFGAFLAVGVWPLIMGVTMFLQMRLNPTPPDPTQQMIFTWMPVVFTFMLARFPAGLVIYWASNNTLSIIQQSVIMKRNGADIALWDNLRGLFRRGKPDPAE